MRRLVIDSASEACTLALFDGDVLIDSRHEVIGRGHAERLVPLIAELAGGGRADEIRVGCGPGSFAGVRVGVAAARALALGWRVPAFGFSTLALIAAGEAEQVKKAGGALVVTEGGHGQWFVQRFDAALAPIEDPQSLYPDRAVMFDEVLVLGSRAAAFVALRGRGRAIERLPVARDFARLPQEASPVEPVPVYVRAPDAKPAGTGVAAP